MNATTSSTKSEKPIGEDAANVVDEACGHLARNNWSDGSVTCRDCNATLSPVDAANGAIGEREAFSHELFAALLAFKKIGEGFVGWHAKYADAIAKADAVLTKAEKVLR